MVEEQIFDSGDDNRRRVIDGLAGDGYVVVPRFFSAVLVRALRAEARMQDQLGGFQGAGVGRRHQHIQNDFAVRRDRTRWLDGSTPAQCQFLQQLELLRRDINRALFLGLFDLESHFAIYSQGDFYKHHLDAFSGSSFSNKARVVSVVVYLNSVRQKDDGGRLRIWPRPDAIDSVLDVVPRAGTLVCFLSEQIPHEVLAAKRERFSIAGWFRRNGSSALCTDSIDGIDLPR